MQPESYNRTTALAVVAVVLSSICLTIIGLLLMLRWVIDTRTGQRQEMVMRWKNGRTDRASPLMFLAGFTSGERMMWTMTRRSN